MEYINKPNKLYATRKTVLDDSAIWIEGGPRIEWDAIDKIRHIPFFGGLVTLKIYGNGQKITVSSQSLENGKLIQNTEVVESLLSHVRSKISHTYIYSKGSNVWFVVGLVMVLIFLVGSSVIMLSIMNGIDLPRRAFSVIAALFVGVLFMSLGRAKNEICNK